MLVDFLKIMKNHTNIYFFISADTVNSNSLLNFLRSARRCAQGVFLGYTTVHLELKNEGPVSHRLLILAGQEV